MYFDFLVKIPEGTGKISLNKHAGITYVEYTHYSLFTKLEVNCASPFY